MIFKTPRNSPMDMAIVGIGYCPPYGNGGVNVESAAKVMPELQDVNGEPLVGKALERAARAWAKERGLVVEIDKEKPLSRRRPKFVEMPKSAVAEEEVSE